jgi:hypothetical protein
MEETPTKSWKTLGIFRSYEEAAAKKEEALVDNDLVKIKRRGKGGGEYHVKIWNEKPLAKKKKKKGKKS